jgi:Co/Zn/Cd efflux system component
MFIIFEAIQRLLDPPEMNTSQLLVVSSVGLAVNLVGMYATGGHHHHGHGHSHDVCSFFLRVSRFLAGTDYTNILNFNSTVHLNQKQLIIHRMIIHLMITRHMITRHMIILPMITPRMQVTIMVTTMTTMSMKVMHMLILTI